MPARSASPVDRALDVERGAVPAVLNLKHRIHRIHVAKPIFRNERIDVRSLTRNELALLDGDAPSSLIGKCDSRSSKRKRSRCDEQLSGSRPNAS